MSELERCMNALEAIGKNYIQKSAISQSPKVARARAITKATQTPEGAVLARRIIQLQRQEVVRKMYAPVIKSMGLDREESREDEWSSMFSKADSEEDLLARLREIEDEKSDIVRQIREKRGLED